MNNLSIIAAGSVTLPENHTPYEFSSTYAGQPVYFEIHVDATQGQDAWVSLEPFLGVGCDFEKFLHFASGDSTAQNFRGFLLNTIGGSSQLYVDGGNVFNFSTVRYSPDRNYATAGFHRLGVGYNPATREIFLYMFYENGVQISYATANSPGDSTSNANDTVAIPYTVSSLQNCVDSTDDELCLVLSANRYYYGAGTTTFEIVTKAADFGIPGGIPSGYTALDEATGTTTAEYDLGDYVPS